MGTVISKDLGWRSQDLSQDDGGLCIVWNLSARVPICNKRLISQSDQWNALLFSILKVIGYPLIDNFNNTTTLTFIFKWSGRLCRTAKQHCAKRGVRWLAEFTYARGLILLNWQVEPSSQYSCSACTYLCTQAFFALVFADVKAPKQIIDLDPGLHLSNIKTPILTLAPAKQHHPSH